MRFKLHRLLLLFTVITILSLSFFICFSYIRQRQLLRIRPEISLEKVNKAWIPFKVRNNLFSF